MKKIGVKITTKSNLLIGGNPTSFQIGGIDQYTITDTMGRPLIPASSLKGVLRRIVKDHAQDSAAERIAQEYRIYLQRIREENRKYLEERKIIIDEYRRKNMENRFEEAIEGASAEYLFGITGFNDPPKLIFHDLLPEEKNNIKDYFSIDSKNQIILTNDDNVKANPRRYQAVRPEITFSGEILFYRIEQDETEKFIRDMLLEFNSGAYRLGNSGSRGYGKIQMEVTEAEE